MTDTRHCTGQTQRIYASCRTDLIAVASQDGGESTIVVKDPVALKYHRLRPDEYFVLRQLDGRTSLPEIRQRYEQAFAPSKVSEADLNQLVLRFHQQGLVDANALTQGQRLWERRRHDARKKWWQQCLGLLVIRFPGMDPEPWLQRMQGMIRAILSWPIIAAAVMLVCFAVVGSIVHWQSLVAELQHIDQWWTFQHAIAILLVIAATKVCHEGGHAMVCKRLGGECHQIGPMLLVFTPALYCDTSDSWMLPTRWKRSMVGLAGVAFEIVLASIAFCVWAATAPGVIHDGALSVMIVCGVSTVIINGNPLLKYDGYFVLSDWCGIANLADRSKQILSAECSRILFGVERPESESQTGMRRVGMLIYAVLSLVYRWAIVLLILWMLSLALRPMGLESIGILICLVVTFGLVVSLCRAPVRFLSNPALRRQIRSRSVLATTAAAVLLAVGLLIPYSSEIRSTGKLVPRSEAIVFVQTPGILANVHAQPGDRVAAGTPLVTLRNDSVQLQYLRAKGAVESQRDLVESLRKSMIEDPEIGNQWAVQQSILADLENQYQTRLARFEALTIRATKAGRLIAAPRREAANTQSIHLARWSGLPTDTRNQRCFLETGDQWIRIVQDDAWDAEVVIDQAQIKRVHQGAEVTIIPEWDLNLHCTGTVTEVSRRPSDTENRLVSEFARTDQVNGAASRHTSYLVRVQIDDVLMEHPIAYGDVMIRIDSPPMSIFQRAQRALNALLRFR